MSNARSGLAGTLRLLDRLPEAVDVQRQALDAQRSLVKDFPEAPLYRRTLAALYGNLGIFLKAQGDLAGAEEAYRKAIEVATELGEPGPTVPEFQHLLANSQFNLGNLFRESGPEADASRAYREALRILKGLVERSPEVPLYRQHLAKVLLLQGHLGMNAGKPREALRAYRECLEVDPKQLEAKYSLAIVLVTTADPDLRDPREGLELAKQLIEQAGANRDYWFVLGVAQHRLGEWKSSLASLETCERLSGDGVTPQHLLVRAMNLWHMGDAAGARRSYDEAVAWIKANGPNDESYEWFP